MLRREGDGEGREGTEVGGSGKGRNLGWSPPPIRSQEQHQLLLHSGEEPSEPLDFLLGHSFSFFSPPSDLLSTYYVLGIYTHINIFLRNA